MAGSRREDGPRARARDRSAWHWLLFVPLIVVLIPQIYNRARPTLFGIPFFYWYQLAVIAVGVTCTLVVYRRTRS